MSFNTPQGEQEEQKEELNNQPQEPEMSLEDQKAMVDSMVNDPLLVNLNRAEMTLNFLKSDPQLTEQNIKSWHENIVHMTKTITELTKTRTKNSDLDELCKKNEEIRVKFDLILKKFPQLTVLLHEQLFQKKPEQEKVAALCRYFEYGDQVYDKEGRQTEFKNYQLKSFYNNKYRDIIKKTITSFLNQQGGTIFIGIRDYDMTVQGIDLSKKDMDTLKLNITEIRRTIEPDCNNLIDVDFIPVIQWGKFAKGKWVVRIKVQQGETNSIYAYKANEEDPFVFSSAFREDGSTQRYELSKFLLESKQVTQHGRQKVEKIQYAQPHEESFHCEVTQVQNLYTTYKDGFKQNNKNDQPQGEGDFKEGQKKQDSGQQDQLKKQNFQPQNNQQTNNGYVKKSNQGFQNNFNNNNNNINNNNNNFNNKNQNNNQSNNNTGNYQYLPVQKQAQENLSNEFQRKEMDSQKLLKEIKENKDNFEKEKKELIEKAVKFEKKYLSKKQKILKLKTKNEELNERFSNKMIEADINTNKLIQLHSDFSKLQAEFQAYKEKILIPNQIPQMNQMNQIFQFAASVQEQQQNVQQSEYTQEFKKKDGSILPVTLTVQPQPQTDKQNKSSQDYLEQEFQDLIEKIDSNQKSYLDPFSDKLSVNEKDRQVVEKPINPKDLQKELQYNDNAPWNQQNQNTSKNDPKNEQNQSQKRGEMNEINNNINKNNKDKNEAQNYPALFEQQGTDKGQKKQNIQPKYDSATSKQNEKPSEIVDKPKESGFNDDRDSNFTKNFPIIGEKNQPEQYEETPGDEQRTGTRNNKREKNKQQGQGSIRYEKKFDNQNEYKNNQGYDNQKYVNYNNNNSYSNNNQFNNKQFQGSQNKWQKQNNGNGQRDHKQGHEKGQQWNQGNQYENKQNVQQNNQKGQNENGWNYPQDKRKVNNSQLKFEEKKQNQAESNSKFDIFSDIEDQNQLTQENDTPELAKVPENDEQINYEMLSEFKFWIIIVSFFEHEASYLNKQLIQKYSEQKKNIQYHKSRKLVSFFFSSKKELQNAFNYIYYEPQEPSFSYFKIIVKGIQFNKEKQLSNQDQTTVIYFNTTQEQLKDPRLGLTQPLVYLNNIKEEEKTKEYVENIFKCKKIIYPKSNNKSKMIISNTQEIINAIEDKQYDLLRKDKTIQAIGFFVDSNIKFNEIINQKGLIRQINELLSDKIVFGKFEFLHLPDSLQIAFDNPTEALIAYTTLKSELSNDWFKNGRQVDLTSVYTIPLG